MPAFSPREHTHRAEHEARIAELQASRWRVGVVDGRWRVAQHDGVSWVMWEQSIEHFGDIDPARERRRLMGWLYELLGCRSAVLGMDYEAHGQGRAAYTLTINS